MNLSKAVPKFRDYACVGDTTVWWKDEVMLTATLEEDTDCSPRDFECYSPEDIERWDKDDWRYVGVCVSAAINGVDLGEVFTLWGVDCNFSDTSNAYLGEVCLDFQDEAVGQARIRAQHMVKALTGPTVTDDFGNLV